MKSRWRVVGTVSSRGTIGREPFVAFRGAFGGEAEPILGERGRAWRTQVSSAASRTTSDAASGAARARSAAGVAVAGVAGAGGYRAAGAVQHGAVWSGAAGAADVCARGRIDLKPHRNARADSRCHRCSYRPAHRHKRASDHEADGAGDAGCRLGADAHAREGDRCADTRGGHGRDGEAHSWASDGRGGDGDAGSHGGLSRGR
jgi:hypothetical protein